MVKMISMVNKLVTAVLLIAGVTMDLNADGKYRCVITNQQQFNSIIERAGGSIYRFKDTCTTIYVKQLSGGYKCYGSESFLTAGDISGCIQLNKSVLFEFEPGAYLDAGDTPFYLWTNADNASLINVDIRGAGVGDQVSGSPVQYSFYHQAYRCMYINCKTSQRKSNAAEFSAFRGDKTDAEYLATTKYIGCIVDSMKNTAGNLRGFHYCYNTNQTYALNLTSTSGEVAAYYYARECVNGHAFLLKARSSAIGFSYCYRINSCYVETIISELGNAFGFYNCEAISASKVFHVIAHGKNVYGFFKSRCIASSHAYKINKENISKNAYGFDQCEMVSSCFAQEVKSSLGDAVGFSACTAISSCIAENITCTATGFNAYPFNNCSNIAACSER